MPSTAPTAGSGYPSIELVFNQCRIHINDTQAGNSGIVGSGRVFTDDWSPSLNVLNLALSHLQRDLENYGLPTTREVIFIINGIPPINGPMGLGVPDPTVQVALSFNGCWDGSILHGTPTLPSDLLMPIEIKQRVTNSGTVFTKMQNAVNDLPSVDQNYLLGWWTWRQDQIFFNGSQNEMDIELRYTGGCPVYPTTLSPSLFPTTLIPFLDSAEALSYRCAYIFCSPRLPKGGADELQANYEAAMLQMANRYIKTAQRSPVSRGSFGDDGGSGDNGAAWGGGW